MAEVQIQEVRKTFAGKTRVLEGVSVTVRDGEFVSLLGPSGCGKSTLLRIVAGLETADSGVVAIGGRDMGGIAPKDRDIAMVFQNYALYPHLSVEENVAMGLRLRGMPAAEIKLRVDEAARMLGLEALLARRPAELSGGQRQRVALARALVRRPKVTLLDEPLSNLDAVLRDRTRGELKLLFKRARGTAIYVTHDQVEAMTLSDRIVVMHRGLVQQIGTPEEIYRRPANTFVAEFVGAPPMNVLKLADAEAAQAARGPAGRSAQALLCGIRPEEIELRPAAAAGFLRAEVALCEPTGAQTILTLEAGALRARASAAGTWNPAAREAFFRFPVEKLHFFDAATGARV